MPMYGLSCDYSTYLMLVISGMQMLFLTRHVLCSKCGFLGWLTVFEDGSAKVEKLAECRPKAREDFQTGKFNGEEQYSDVEKLVRIHCYRMQWVFAPHAAELTRKLEDANTVRQPRRCPYYIKYEPGFGPEEHKELKRESDTRRIIVISSIISAIIGAVIGSALTIIVNLVSK